MFWILCRESTLAALRISSSERSLRILSLNLWDPASGAMVKVLCPLFFNRETVLSHILSALKEDRETRPLFLDTNSMISIRSGWSETAEPRRPIFPVLLSSSCISFLIVFEWPTTLTQFTICLSYFLRTFGPKMKVWINLNELFKRIVSNISLR